MDNTAALPWGSSDEQQVDEAVEETDLPQTHGLQLGQRVEVQWQLDDEEGAPIPKWWGAVLDSRPEGETDGEGRQVYVLRYDVDLANGFEEQECCRVTFLDEHVIYDFGQDDELVWRKAGDTWEPSVVSEPEDGTVSYSFSEIEASIKASERRRGRTLDEDAAEALAALPQEKQRLVAAGYRDFIDKFNAGMAKLLQQQAAQGADYVVTSADVKAVMRDAGLG